MTITPIPFFYDGVQRRFLEQIVRAFSGYQYMPGIRNGVQSAAMMVPCRMANHDKTVANIMQNVSTNTLLTVPLITVWQTGLEGRRADVQYPGHIDTLQVTERAISGGKYTSAKGNSYTVQRLMPRPFEMKVQVDIWTSNMEQKAMLMEQILTVVYPTFDIQNSENALDWTALSTMTLTDITYSSVSMPVGTSNDIDVASMVFSLPIWLSPPAKVREQHIIQTIITNIYEQHGSSNQEIISDSFMSRNITTPGDYHVRVEGNEVTLLNSKGGEFMADGSVPSWTSTLALYGNLNPTVSQIRFTTSQNFDDPAFIAGTIQLDPVYPNKLIWQLDVDTLPGNTLPPVNAILTPANNYPGHGIPFAAAGQRYLLMGDLNPSNAWGTFTAKENDIITYNGMAWVVSFQATINPTPQHMLNLHTGNQLRWTGTEWTMGIDNIYPPGYWHLAL